MGAMQIEFVMCCFVKVCIQMHTQAYACRFEECGSFLVTHAVYEGHAVQAEPMMHRFSKLCIQAL